MIHTLIEAMVLVFVVMYLFLQNIRYTLIPTIVVPISLLGGFAFISYMGMSINVLTMFAMVLVIGIVVDDAIVVVEIGFRRSDFRVRTVGDVQRGDGQYLQTVCPDDGVINRIFRLPCADPYPCFVCHNVEDITKRKKVSSAGLTRNSTVGRTVTKAGLPKCCVRLSA
ncbi:acrB/AcrD/AcrF family protein [Neisseria meningitidis 2005040]|nr:acrB/AcrD/AcrF family protein [Neisseria meningitidis 2005040]